MVDLESIFPRLHKSTYHVTSPATQDYNCIAWAAGDSLRWWWPNPSGQRYWPPNVAREETITAFQDAFSSLGFTVCQDDGIEPDFEKIAIFGDNDLPLHAARQLENGMWTSKIGELEDIEHVLRDLEGVEYGTVVRIMTRPRSR